MVPAGDGSHPWLDVVGSGLGYMRWRGSRETEGGVEGDPRDSWWGKCVWVLVAVAGRGGHVGSGRERNSRTFRTGNGGKQTRGG